MVPAAAVQLLAIAAQLHDLGLLFIGQVGGRQGGVDRRDISRALEGEGPGPAGANDTTAAEIKIFVAKPPPLGVPEG
ncbi:MAG: hypothetical protein ACFCUW_15500 [Kiloniellaceae bacterium]